MNESDDNHDLEEPEENYPETLETDDESLADQYNPNLVATRAVDEEALQEQTARFTASPFLELIKDVSTLRQLYGATDPTINDLCEDIQSSLTEILTSIRSNPMGMILEVAKLNPNELTNAKHVVENLLKHFEEDPEA